MAKLVSETRTKTRTWMGRAGDHKTYCYDKSQYGRRISIIRWHDTGEYELTAVKGDGRTTKFVRFETRTLPAFAGWDDAKVAVHAMADRHFI